MTRKSTKKTQNSAQRKPVQKRALETRGAILKATAQILLSKDGMPGLNSNAIAEKAGVSIGSFYQYYVNKEAVLAELVQERLKLLLGTMAQFLSADEAEIKKNPREFLNGMMVALLGEFKKDQLLALLMFQFSEVIADQKRMEKVDQEWIPAISELIRKTVPSIRKKNLDQSVFILMQSYRGVVAIASARRFKGLDINDLASEITDLFWRYLTNAVVD